MIPNQALASGEYCRVNGFKQQVRLLACTICTVTGHFQCLGAVPSQLRQARTAFELTRIW